MTEKQDAVARLAVYEARLAATQLLQDASVVLDEAILRLDLASHRHRYEAGSDGDEPADAVTQEFQEAYRSLTEARREIRIIRYRLKP